MFTALGFIITPVILSDTIMKRGVLLGLLWYQIIMLPGSVICMFIKKPKYIKQKTRNYNLIQTTGEDDEDVIFRSSTELSNKIQAANQTNDAPASTSNNLDEIKVDKSKKTWESFNENDKNKSNSSKINLERSFSHEFSADLGQTQSFEDNFVQPIFNDVLVNNNTSYSYEAFDQAQANDQPVVFMPVSKQNSTLIEDFQFITQPTFYKSLLQIITTKYSIFMYFSLFPSFLYDNVHSIKVHHTCYVVGLIGISSLAYATFNVVFEPLIIKKRAIFLACFCWMGTLGYIRK